MFDPAEIQRLPQETGVYLMRDAEGEVLYVGKANNIRARVRQYFSGQDTRSMIPHLLEKLATIEAIVVSSERGALLLENNLIKKHWPRYNVLLKDDKAFFSLRLSRHRWPSLELARLRSPPKDGSRIFGPFPSAWAARSMRELVQQLFPLRRCSDRELASRVRPCILYEMGKCIAPCVDLCSSDQYTSLVQQVIRFLEGDTAAVERQLRADLHTACEALEYERAGQLHRTLAALQQIEQEQSVEKGEDLHADVWALHREGTRVAVVQLCIRQGKLQGMEHALFQEPLGEDAELISSLLLQAYDGEVPPLIVTALPLSDDKPLEELLSERRGRAVRIVHPRKGDKAALVAMAQRNAAAVFHRHHAAREVQEELLCALQQALDLERYPARIEVVDVSHLGGKEAVGVVVSFLDGERESQRYRKYRLRDTPTGDDYAGIREVLRRRFRGGAEAAALPQLLLIDGGKGHLRAAHEVLESLGLAAVMEVMALSKEQGRHDRGLTVEELHLLYRSEPIRFERHAPLLLLLQRLRDEAHRFALQFQKERRKRQIVRSELDAIPGIGPTKKRALLRTFGSVARIAEAGAEELRRCKQLTRADIQQVLEWAQGRPRPPPPSLEQEPGSGSKG